MTNYNFKMFSDDIMERIKILSQLSFPTIGEAETVKDSVGGLLFVQLKNFKNELAVCRYKDNSYGVMVGTIGQASHWLPLPFFLSSHLKFILGDYNNYETFMNVLHAEGDDGKALMDEMECEILK